MSKDLVRRWRRIARRYAACITPEELRAVPGIRSSVGQTQGYIKALRQCADSLELSISRRARRAPKEKS